MDIHNDNTRKVRCIRNDNEVWNGGTYAHLLTIGELYTVVWLDVQDWYTEVGLAEFPGKSFNSVLFEELDGDE